MLPNSRQDNALGWVLTLLTNEDTLPNNKRVNIPYEGPGFGCTQFKTAGGAPDP